MAEYVGTVMNRTKISDNLCVFNVERLIIGELKEDTLIDEKGNKYCPTISKEGIEGNDMPSVGFLMKVDELKSKLGEDYLTIYSEIAKNNLIVAKKTKDGEYISFLFNLDNEEEINEKAPEQGGLNNDETEESLDDYYNRLFEEAYGNLDNYSKEELLSLKEEIQNGYNQMNSALNRINSKINSKSKKQKKNKHINIDEVHQKITKTLIAQDDPARRVLIEIDKKDRKPLLRRKAVLLTGNTGVGKTELMRQIAKHLDRPFLKIDATQLSIPGYVGRSLEECLWELLIQCDFDVKRAERAIVYIDEIDKKGSKDKSDVSGQGVLNTLLPFIEGTVYFALSNPQSRETIAIDTTNMIKILGGAYTDVYKNLKMKNSLGFGGEVSSKPRMREATKEDFVTLSMMTEEFMGRVTIVRLNDLEVKDLKRIVLESDESFLKINQELFADVGVKLTYTDGFIDKLAEKAYKLKTGARGIGDIIDSATWMAYNEAVSIASTNSHNRNKYELCLTEDILDDPSLYEITKIEPQKTYQKGKSTKKIG